MGRILILLLAILCQTSFAFWDVKVVNKSNKPIQFSILMVDTARMSNLYTVEARSTTAFSFDQMGSCKDDPYCTGAQYYFIVRKWGDFSVFTRSEKLFNPKNSTQYYKFKISGRDSSEIYLNVTNFKPKNSGDKVEHSAETNEITVSTINDDKKSF